MEIAEIKPIWLDKNHPNYERWKRARDVSINRGLFVKFVIEETIKPNGLNILDLGSGEGGTSQVLSGNNFVISFDLNKERLSRQTNSDINFKIICGNISDLPFTKSSFDLIILQDVIEHLPEKELLFNELYDLLRENGVIYLSTPNRFSILNIIADPHWGLPFLSVFKRESVRKYFLKYFRSNELKRNDIAELLSLNEILRLIRGKFDFRLFTKESVIKLFEGNRGIVWSNFHLKLIRIVKKFSLEKFIIRTANNNISFVNKFFTPTFYIILKKK